MPDRDPTPTISAIVLLSCTRAACIIRTTLLVLLLTVHYSPTYLCTEAVHQC